MEEIKLPNPDTTGGVPLETCISKRRSVRRYIDEPLTIEQLSQLAWCAQGITEKTRGLRAVPSGGATYPTELYLVTRDGVFNYIPAKHSLRKTMDGDIRAKLSKACLGQGFITQAALSVVIGMVYPRTMARYGARGERYIILEAGHIAQNLHLEAIALGLDSVAVGAYNDEAVSDVVGLPDEVAPVYIVAIGKAG
jgi:SagB-type dehydrogenase family enzyme